MREGSDIGLQIFSPLDRVQENRKAIPVLVDALIVVRRQQEVRIGLDKLCKIIYYVVHIRRPNMIIAISQSVDKVV